MTNLKLNKTSVIEFSFEWKRSSFRNAGQHYLNMVFIKEGNFNVLDPLETYSSEHIDFWLPFKNLYLKALLMQFF